MDGKTGKTIHELMMHMHQINLQEQKIYKEIEKMVKDKKRCNDPSEILYLFDIIMNKGKLGAKFNKITESDSFINLINTFYRVSEKLSDYIFIKLILKRKKYFFCFFLIMNSPNIKHKDMIKKSYTYLCNSFVKINYSIDSLEESEITYLKKLKVLIISLIFFRIFTEKSLESEGKKN